MAPTMASGSDGQAATTLAKPGSQVQAVVQAGKAVDVTSLPVLLAFDVLLLPKQVVPQYVERTSLAYLLVDEFELVHSRIFSHIEQGNTKIWERCLISQAITSRWFTAALP
jgi:hypothetical protein